MIGQQIATLTEARSVMDLTKEWKVVGRCKVSMDGYRRWMSAGDIALGSLAEEARKPDGKFSMVTKRLGACDYVAYARMRP